MQDLENSIVLVVEIKKIHGIQYLYDNFISKNLKIKFLVIYKHEQKKE